MGQAPASVTEPDRREGESATTERYLAEVTIGALEPLNGTIYLAPYDSAWASKFVLLAGRIRAALAGKVLLLEHVGSTSVPGHPCIHEHTDG